MRWEIKPFVGLGPIRFGMTPQEVGGFDNVIGTVRKTYSGYDGSWNERRAISMPNFGYVNNQLIFIGTAWPMKDVFWNGLEVYQSDPKSVLQALERANCGAKIIFGVVTFDHLGIEVSGFYLEKENKFYDPASGEQDDRGLSILERNKYNDSASKHAEHLRPISFLDW